jgi:hypothetical protein
MRIHTSDTATNTEAMRQQFFARADRNGDQKISKDEFAAMAPPAAQAGGQKGPTSDDIFSLLDANQDGSIDQTEAENGMKAMESRAPQGGRGPAGPPSAQNMAETMFKKADSDQDGGVTKSELSALGKDDKSKDALSKLFDDADSDGDGKVTQSDLEKALQKRFQGLSTYGASGSLLPVQGSRLSTLA